VERDRADLGVSWPDEPESRVVDEKEPDLRFGAKASDVNVVTAIEVAPRWTMQRLEGRASAAMRAISAHARSPRRHPSLSASETAVQGLADRRRAGPSFRKPLSLAAVRQRRAGDTRHSSVYSPLACFFGNENLLVRRSRTLAHHRF
jgi:hypothetical protein